MPAVYDATKRKSRARNKRTTYVLSVTAVKLPNMNEAEFLKAVKELFDNMYAATDTVAEPTRVSVKQRIEEFL